MAKDYKVGQIIMKTNRTAIAALCLLVVACVFISARPVAAESLSKKWTEGECKTVKGDWQNNDCYVKQVPVNLGVSIGGLSKATLSQYIGAGFNLGVGLAAVFAVIFIMIGGFRYLYAAGGGEVDAAKGMIKNAIIGLVLTAMSYTLLQTVNPALVSLELPPVKLVKSAYLSQLKKSSGIQVNGPCYTIQDKEACAQACVDAKLNDQCECTVIDEGIWSSFAKASTWIAVGSVSGAAGAYRAAGSALQKIGSTGVNIATRIWQYTKTNPFKAAAGVYEAGKTMSTPLFLAGLGYEMLPEAPDKGEEGICLPLTVNSVPPGGVCFKDINCTMGKCITINENPPYGMCMTGEENTGCDVGHPGFMVNNESLPCATAELKCCTVNGMDLGTCQKSCGGRPNGNTCEKASDCANGVCATIPDHATAQETNRKICTGGVVGDYCSLSGECLGNTYCPTPFYSCTSTSASNPGCPLYRVCATKGATGNTCCSNSECANGTCQNAHPNSSTKRCSVVNDVCESGSCGTCN